MSNVSQGGSFFDILAKDVKTGQLPSVSWIVAPEAYTEHPARPAGWGAWYTAGVLNALTSDPDVWSKIALLITLTRTTASSTMSWRLPECRRTQRAVDGALTVENRGRLGVNLLVRHRPDDPERP